LQQFAASRDRNGAFAVISMLTSPLETSLARAARMITTSASTMAVNMPMARKIS